MLEPELVGVDADEAPHGEDDDPEHVEAEHLAARHAVQHMRCGSNETVETHSLRGDLEALLDEPEEAAPDISWSAAEEVNRVARRTY